MLPDVQERWRVGGSGQAALSSTGLVRYATEMDFDAVVTTLSEIGSEGYLVIEAVGCSAEETNSLGALWGNLSITPEDIAFQGADRLRGLLS
jgi:hypothetical protein